MPVSKTKIKVRVSELLAAVEARKAATIKAQEKELELWFTNKESFPNQVVKDLETALEKARKGTLPEKDYYGFLKVKTTAKKDSKPTKGTQNLDRLIATLKMAAEETIAISADDASEYLG